MQKVLITILISLVSLALYAQKAKLTKEDFQTVKKIEGGNFSNAFYLRAIIEQEIADSNVLKLQRKWGDLNDMFCHGFIQSIIKKNHNGRYECREYFTSFNFEAFNGKNYFYQNVSLYNNNELFIWGTYEKNDSMIEIHSAIGDAILEDFELSTYTAIFKTINGADYIIFEADEHAVVAPIEDNKLFIVRYDVEALDKKGVYRKCVSTCDTCITCKRTMYIGTTDQIKKHNRVFTSELIIDDIDKDGVSDLYWFAVSNGKLIKYESYILRAEGLTGLKKDIKNLIVETPRFKEIQKISKLKQVPDVGF